MRKALPFILSALTLIILIFYVMVNFNNIFGLASITGRQVMSTRLVILSQLPSVCNTTFEPGWNLVSFPCITSDTEISLFLANISGSFESIKTYDQFDSQDPWKSYNPGLPAWVVQDLPEVARREGYWIYFENITDFYMNNSLTTPTVYNLMPGWNLIGYPSTMIARVNETLAGLNQSYDYVFFYNASDLTDPWKQYTWNASLPSDQDLIFAVPYYGYWIYVLKQDSFVIS